MANAITFYTSGLLMHHGEDTPSLLLSSLVIFVRNAESDRRTDTNSEAVLGQLTVMRSQLGQLGPFGASTAWV